MDFDALGFAIVPGFLSGEMCDLLIAEIGSVRGAGLRQPHQSIRGIQELLENSAIRALAPEGAFVVRSILFDKSAGRNWAVPWHQDLAICVKARREAPGFEAWSVKEGIVHVHAPPEILEKMFTVRLHLDECGEGNGPLRVIPGSHRHGRLSDAEVDAWRAKGREVTCLVPRGGALVMRPLLLHASSRATEVSHRRVLHLEFATEALPFGLEWLIG